MTPLPDPSDPHAANGRPQVPAGLAEDASTRAIAAYGELRDRLSALMRTVDADLAASTITPACPAWTVTQTFAHVVGVTIDITDGNIAEAGTAPWADLQVGRFAILGIDGLLERWQETAEVIDSLGGLIPDATASQLLFDAASHEQDIRGALGIPGGRESSAIEIGFGFLLHSMATGVEAGRVPPLVLHLEDVDVVVGTAEPAAEVTAPRWELFRAFGGRRSVDQIRALPWDGDPDPYLALLEGGPVAPPAVALVE